MADQMYRLVCVDLQSKSSFQSYEGVTQHCKNLNKAMKFIQSNRHTHILFVVSDRLGEESLSRLKIYRHVRHVFILKYSLEDFKIDSDQYESLVGIFHTEGELIDAVRKKIVTLEKQVLPFSVFDQQQRTSQDLTRRFNTFLWYQVLFHTLRQMPADEQAKEEMLQVCSDYYQANPREEGIIKKYRVSSSEAEAINWYTRQTFFFKLANQALRTEDMFLVYQFRHWIKQLCSAIACEHRKQNEDRSWTLHSGFQLHEDEFERLKKSTGSLISINSFLSTSRNIKVAQFFAGDGPIEKPLVRVLLQIEANPAHLNSVFFADVSGMSEFPEEEEVLFSLGSTFRIISIDFDVSFQRWIVQLKATDDESDRIEEYRQLANHEIQSTSPMIHFGMILNENLDQSDRAVRYFRGLLKFVGKDHPDLPKIYDALGDAYAQRKEIPQSVVCYKKERKIQRKQGTLPSSPNQTKRESLQKKLAEEENKPNGSPLNRANILRELAECSNYAQAEVYLKQALQIYEEMNIDSSLLSTCMEDIAWNYQRSGNRHKCLDFRYRRLTVEEKYLPVANQKLRETLEDIMRDGRCPDDYRRFIKFCQEKISTLRQSLSEDHPRLIHMQDCLEEMEDKLQDFEEEHTKWIEASQNIDQMDFHQRRKLYHDKSNFYRRNGLFNESIQCLLTLLEIYQSIDGDDPEKIIGIFDDIAQCYREMSDYRQTFVYLEKAFRSSQSIEQINPRLVSTYQKKIDNLVHTAARYHIQLPWTPVTPDDENIPW